MTLRVAAAFVRLHGRRLERAPQEPGAQGLRDLQRPVRNGLVAVARTTRTPRHIGVAPEEGRVGGSTPRGARAQLHIPAAGALPSEAVGFDSPVGLLVGTYLLDASEGAPTPTAALCLERRAMILTSRVCPRVCVQATQLVSALLYSAARLSALDSAAILGLRHSSCPSRHSRASCASADLREVSSCPSRGLACRRRRRPRLPPPPLAATIRQRSSNGSRHERADQQTTTTRHRRLECVPPRLACRRGLSCAPRRCANGARSSPVGPRRSRRQCASVSLVVCPLSCDRGGLRLTRISSARVLYTTAIV